jgi:hypothetical protein
MSDINKQAEFYKAGAFPDKTDRQYELILMRLERWLDELATFGPKHVTEVYNQMAKVIENEQGMARPEPSICEPCIDFNHQKGYN